MSVAVVQLIYCIVSAHIQQLKHSVPKGDKKKKKEITSQVALLEAELEARHEKELADLKHSVSDKSQCKFYVCMLK
jgi:OTU domain-containing protein 6